MKIRGAIFDLDGTILDSTWVWQKIDIDFLGKHGFSVPDDYVDAITPMGFGEAADYTIERFSLPNTRDEVMEEWNRMAEEAYMYKVKVKAGTETLLKFLRERGVAAGVATSNNARLYEPCLKNNGVYRYFHSFTEVREVARGKEFADIYIKAAEKLGCEPTECLVFEDIIPALKSARSGGFTTVGVWEGEWRYDRESFEASCDYCIEDICDAPALLNFLK